MYLENMKCLKLDILTLIPQQVHHHLQICLVRDIFSHHVEISTVEENFAEKFEGLSLRDVVCREDERCEGGEELGIRLMSEQKLEEKKGGHTRS